MKLISVHIENFGVLQSFDYEFRDGLNVRLSDNGTGKTTFGRFLQAMFYGMGRGGRTSRRLSFAPWQGGAFGGSVRFEKAGKKYLLTRSFGRKESEDTFELRDADTNAVIGDFSENDIGDRLFGVSEETFLRTLFIGQQSVQTESDSDIQSKMNSIASGDIDLRRFDEIQKRLQEKRTQLQSDVQTNTGSIPKKRNEIAGKEQLRREKEQEVSGIERVKREILETEAAIEKNKEEEQEWNRKRSLTLLFSRRDFYRGLLRKQEERRLELSDREAKLQEIPGEEEITKGISAADSLRRTEDKISARTERYAKDGEELEKAEEKLRAEDEERKKEKEEKTEEKRNALTKTAAILLTAGIIFAFSGMMIAILWQKLPGIVMTSAGVIGAVTGIFFLLKKQKVKSDYVPADFEPFRKQGAELERNFQEDRELLEKEREESLRVLRSLLKKAFGTEIPEEEYEKKLYECKELAGDVSQAREELLRAMADVKNFEAVNNISELRNLPENAAVYSEETIGEKVDGLRADYRRLAERKAQKESELQKLFETEEDLRSLIEEIDDLKAEEREETREHRILTDTMRHLKNAYSDITEKYQNPTLRAFRHFYSELTGEDENLLHLSEETVITVDEKGQQRELSKLSAGYQDLLYLCLRLSFIEAMYPEEKPFIILDDVFVNLDEKKTDQALRLLLKTAEKYQILYQTCHSSRIPKKNEENS